MARALLEKLFERDGGKCRYCGVAVTLPRRGVKLLTDATRDHIKPKSMGGTDALSNQVLACRECNQGKADGPARRMAID